MNKLFKTTEHSETNLDTRLKIHFPASADLLHNFEKFPNSPNSQFIPF